MPCFTYPVSRDHIQRDRPEAECLDEGRSGCLACRDTHRRNDAAGAADSGLTMQEHWSVGGLDCGCDGRHLGGGRGLPVSNRNMDPIESCSSGNSVSVHCVLLCTEVDDGRHPGLGQGGIPGNAGCGSAPDRVAASGEVFDTGELLCRRSSQQSHHEVRRGDEEMESGEQRRDDEQPSPPARAVASW